MWRVGDQSHAGSKIYKLHGSPEVNAPEIIVKQMIKKIELCGPVGLTVAIQLRQGGIPKQIEELWLKWEALRQHIDKIAREAAQYTGAGLFVGSANGLTRNERRQQERDAFKSLKKDKSGNGQNANPRNTGQPTKQQPTVTEMCRGCGRRHKTSDCKLIEGKHPDANTSSEAWASSVKGKAWKTAGFDFCQFERRIDGSAHAFALNKPKGSGGAASGGKFDKRGSTKSESDLLLYKRYDTLFIASTRSDITHTVPMKLRVPDTSFPLNVDCLIDTGALQSNYISNRTAAWLKATWDKEREVGVLDDKFVCVACNNCKHSTTSNLNSTSTNKPKMVNNKRKRAAAATGDKQPPSLPSRNRVTTVCSGISGMCTESPRGEMVFDITFFNEVTGSDETWHNVVAKILDTPYDFILGLPDIRKHNMLNKVKSHFQDVDRKPSLVESSVASKSDHEAPKPRSYTTDLRTAPSNSTVNATYTKDELLTPEVDDDGIIWAETDHPWDHDASEEVDHFDREGDSGPQPHVAGTPELQEKLRTLIKEYKHIFCEELRPDPALVSPSELQVDQPQWRTPKNGGPARP